jgi:hypothetical protein
MWSYLDSRWQHNKGLIKSDEGSLCLDAPPKSGDGLSSVHAWTCHGNVNQLWSYDPEQKQLRSFHGKCLARDGKRRVALADCSPADPNQRWEFGHFAGRAKIRVSGSLDSA